MNFGLLSLVPPFVVIITAIWTKRSFESLIVGCVVGYAMIDFSDSNVWIIYVCGFYGALIELMVRSGGGFAFGEYMLRFVKTRRSALVMTWLLGLFIFLDDYMSALTVGNTMKRITDRFHISREMLAFLVNVTAAPLCVIVPLSTWTIYAGSEIAKATGRGESEKFECFLQTIPYMFYAWSIVIIALLVALGWFPIFGKLRKFEEKARLAGEQNDLSANPKIETATHNGTAMDFIIPILVLIASTVFFDIEALKGVVFTLGFTIIFYLFRKRLNYDNIFEGCFGHPYYVVCAQGCGRQNGPHPICGREHPTQRDGQVVASDRVPFYGLHFLHYCFFLGFVRHCLTFGSAYRPDLGSQSAIDFGSGHQCWCFWL
jgi:tetracycline resistance efflux pump